ncbi:MAG: HdeD family acid-resistance protein [Chitinophagaceae bacterium]
MSNLIEDIQCNVKNWWWYLVSGLLFIATGIVIFASPAASYVNLSIVFSILMIGNGFSQIIFSSANSNVLRGWGWTLVSGIIDVALGTYLLLYPAVTMATLPFFVGFWLIFRSFYLMGTAFDLKALGVQGWGWVLFGAIVVLVLGGVIVYYPAAGVVSIITFSGSAFILGGFMNIYLAFLLKAVKGEVKEVKNAVGSVTGTFQKAV